ncbi:DUF3365 domain-containing protein [Stieleria sp.]|uniref:c-type heme family protein n=1 Tax=Stieleria sp. TaxID=2795976 RepID=UPI003568B27F
MKRNVVLVSILLGSLGVSMRLGVPKQLSADDSHPTSSATSFPAPTTMLEARARAKLLHEAIRGTLQVVHRDFFDEDDAHAIPSASLEDVFHAMSESYDVELKWLIVETDVVNVDHQPEDEFEKDAVRALKSGKPMHEAVQAERYRFAGPIRLASQCLKCHVKNRKSTEDRTAGLLISMPLVQRSF